MTFLPGVQGPACWGPGQQEGQVRGVEGLPCHPRRSRCRTAVGGRERER